jgi:hypothetical protein
MIWLVIGIALIVGGLFGLALTLLLILLSSDDHDVNLEDN